MGGSFPFVLGSDCAGTVVAAGSRVRRVRQGDLVYAYGFLNPKGGFYAEYAVVSEDEVSPAPGTLTPDEAGVLAVDGLTAMAGLDILHTGPDQRLVIVGASGGVGHLALQLAKRRGARVFAVASGEDGVAFARRLGADDAIDGRAGDVAARIREFAPDGLDAVLFLTDARTDEIMGLVRQGGLVAYPNGVGYPHGIERGPALGSGIALRAYDGYHGHDALERLSEAVAAAPFHVEVSRTYALDEAPEALRDVSKHHLGKLALRVH
jgi:NADPH:quinone reductase-like Zn-dependent oxidoreductase